MRQANTPKKLSRRAARARAATPLAWLGRRRRKNGMALLARELVQAGERLAVDFQVAQMQPRVTMDWSAVKVDGGLRPGTPATGVDAPSRVIAAQKRVYAALEAVGPELAGLLVDICCLEQGLEVVERAEGWPQRASKVILELALTRLARHYGFLAPVSVSAVRLRHWGDAGYRPIIPRDP